VIHCGLWAASDGPSEIERELTLRTQWHPPEKRQDFHLERQLLSNLADQRIRFGLVSFDLSTGEFPSTGQ
jgi:hypothetical protein